MIGDRRVDEHLFTGTSSMVYQYWHHFCLKTLIQVLKDFCLSYILFVYPVHYHCLSFDANQTDK